MKKIVLYIGSLGRCGAERVMTNIANYLSNQYEVTLVSDANKSADGYPLDERINCVCLGMTNGGLKGNLKRIKMLREIVRHAKPDAVLSFMGPTNIRMLLATSDVKVRKIVSVRNDPRVEYGNGLRRAFARLIFRSASGCVFQTQEAMDYFQKSVRRKSKIIWNPVADKFFERSWTPVREEIAVVGRLVPQKNPLLALESFRLISDGYPNVHLTYYGSGPLKESIIAKADEYKLNDRVTIIDNVPNIEDYISSARLFLMASNFEGMPNALMEAMTVGLPCLSTDCPCGGPKAISEGFSADMLVPCNDAEAIASRMKGLLSDESKQKELSSKERERSSLFRMELVMKKWEDFLFKE